MLLKLLRKQNHELAKLFWFCLTFLCFNLVNLQSQSADISIQKHTQADGLTLSSYFNILRDSSDMLWILGLQQHPVTGESGLDLISYDGERFISRGLPKMEEFKQGNLISIFPWSNGHLLLQTSSPNHNYIYDPNTREVITRHNKSISIISSAPYKNRLYSIALDENEKSVLGYLGDSLFVILFQSNLLDNANALYPADDGFWICKPGLVYKLNSAGQLIYQINLDNEKENNYIHANTERGIEIFFPGNNPILIDRKTGTKIPFQNAQLYRDNEVSVVEVDNHGNTIYVFTERQLIERLILVSKAGNVFDLSKLKYELTDVLRIIGDNFLESFWIAGTTGIIEVDIQSTSAAQYLLNAELRKIKLINDQIYIATESGGIYRSENRPDLNFGFVSDERNPRLIEMTSDGYFLTNDLGLFYKKKNGEVKTFDNHSAALDAITLNDTLLVIASRSGISFANAKNWTVTHIDEHEFNFIHKLLRVNNNSFLIGSADGLAIIDITRGNKTQLFSRESVLSITQEDVNEWWFGTVSGQLYRFKMSDADTAF